MKRNHLLGLVLCATLGAALVPDSNAFEPAHPAAPTATLQDVEQLSKALASAGASGTLSERKSALQALVDTADPKAMPAVSQEFARVNIKLRNAHDEAFKARYSIERKEQLVESLEKRAENDKSLEASLSTQREKLRERIFQVVSGGVLKDLSPEQLRERLYDLLAELEYGRHSNRVRSILLLFNLATMLLNPASNMRFQFENFKTGMWDIEHVRSIKSEPPVTWKEQKTWVERCLGYIKTVDGELDWLPEVHEWLALDTAKEADDEFETLYERLLDYFKEAKDTEPDHTLANLALLDSKTNRSYKNAPFAVKRQRILSLDRDGVFVPLCTRNVFLKCYNESVDNVMFWSQEDRDAYQKVIEEVLSEFFNGEWIHA